MTEIGSNSRENEMPIYEYRCESCGARFEKLVSYSQRDEVKCENCGAEQTTRQISSFATYGSSSSCGPSGGSRFR